MAIATQFEDMPLGKQGRPLKEEEKHSDTNVFPGENAEYLTRRIARDRPDVLQRMKAGR